MQLLDEIPENTYLTHSTSIEAIFHLIKHGHMPPADNNDFYFLTIGDNFAKSKYANEPFVESHSNYPNEGKEQETSSMNFYGKTNAQRHYLVRKIGFEPEWIANAWPETFDEYYNALTKYEPCLNEKRAQYIAHKLTSLKGVVIIPSVQLFKELNHIVNWGSSGVYFYSPNSLEQKHIQSVVPLGSLEKRILKRII